MAATNHGCDQVGCQGYFSYIRFKKKWIKIGVFHSKCKSFILFDDIQLPEDKKEQNFPFGNDEFLKFWFHRSQNHFDFGG